MRYQTEQIVFWLSLGVLAYVYAGYPLVVYLVSVLFPRRVKRAEIEPSVTMLITAYNEEKRWGQTPRIFQLPKNLARKFVAAEPIETQLVGDGMQTDRFMHRGAPPLTCNQQIGTEYYGPRANDLGVVADTS